MIPLNKPFRLPSAALWYWLVRSLFVCGAIVVFAYLLHSGLVSSSCRGAMCGSSGKSFTWILYLFAGLLGARTIVNTLTCSFVLSDKSITINRGLLFRDSSTIRFDRIQDVRGSRGPLLSAFGLEAIALWTASPDQRVGNSKRPDGQLYLNVGDAEWLKQFLAEPSASPAPELASKGSAQALGAPDARSPAIVACVFLIVAALAVWALIHVLHPSATLATSTTTPAYAPPVAPPVSATSPTASTKRSPAEAAQAPKAMTCALPGSGGHESAIPCHEQAERCQRERDFASSPTATPAALTLINRGASNLQLFWLDTSGARRPYGMLMRGGSLTQPTHLGARWLLATSQGQCVGIFDAATVVLDVAY